MNVHWLRRAAASLLAIAALAGCTTAAGPRGKDEILIVGSDTMLPLNRHLAAEFMDSHPGAVVLVQGGGTGIGARALIDGRTTFCAASRNLRAEEVEALFAATGTLGLRFMVALDAIAVYLHPEQAIKSLGMDELAAVFSGLVKSWDVLGGERAAVLPIIRPPTSGTHRFFRDHVLGGKPYAGHAVTVQRTSDVISEVAVQPHAIGYGGLAYSGAVRHCEIDGVLPEESTVRNGSYPLSRYLYLITAEPPEGLAREFVDWVTGPEGQGAVAEVGLIALWVEGER
jgi:phosphate transport system substrate-binding protein